MRSLKSRSMRKLYNYLSILGIITLSGFISYFSFLPKNQSAASVKAVADAKEVEPQPVYEYGLRVDTFEVHKATVERNEFVSEILSRYKVDAQTIHDLSINASDVFDFKKLKAGNDYTILASDDKDSVGHYMIYEKNPVEYIVYNLKDPNDIKLEKRPVERKESSISGVITSSLWNTMINANADPDLAVSLSQVFQWTIDFTRINAGDKFKAVYDDLYVEGKRLKSDSIKAAYFMHGDKEYYAFYFEQDSTKQSGFYDETGASLKRAFLRAPVKYSRISSRYTKRRFHPVQKRYKAHLGTDYAAPYGTPIYATGDGVIETASYTRGNGRYVKIKHPNGYKTQYLHMSKIASGSKPGRAVKQGDVIGYVGSTGLATGPHVCYRFWKNGKQVDHLKLDLPAGDPIEEKYIDKFEEVKRIYLQKLEQESLENENDDSFTFASADKN